MEGDASRYQKPKGSCAPYSRSPLRRAQSEELDDATYIDVISARVTCASITAILRMIETARKEVRAGKQFIEALEKKFGGAAPSKWLERTRKIRRSS